jgi:sulfur relay (sulfurtransferase) DsrC/TusE family protein
LQDAEKQELQHQKEAFMTEVEQWSQGEVEAIQAAAAAKLAQEQRAVEHW